MAKLNLSFLKKMEFETKFKFGFNDKAEFKQWIKQALKHTECKLICDKSFLEILYEEAHFGFKYAEDFYEWLNKQPKKCYFCGTSQSKLYRIKNKVQNIPKLKALLSPILQVAKINQNKPYNQTNCVLACAFCKNVAEVSIVNAENFKKYLVKSVNLFYDDLFKGKIGNKIPFYEDKDNAFYMRNFIYVELDI